MCEMSRIHGELREEALAAKWIHGTRTESLVEGEETAQGEYP